MSRRLGGYFSNIEDGCTHSSEDHRWETCGKVQSYECVDGTTVDIPCKATHSEIDWYTERIPRNCIYCDNNGLCGAS